MRFLPLIIAASGALAALTACSQAESTDAGAPTEAKATESGGPITISDFPSPKAGLWRVTTVTDGEEPEIEVRCEGPNKPFEAPESMPGCVDTASRIPGGVRFDRKCMADGQPATLAVTMTGDFNSRTIVDIAFKTTIPGGETVETRTRAEAVYQGACAAGQKPDTVVEAGQ